MNTLNELAEIEAQTDSYVKWWKEIELFEYKEDLEKSIEILKARLRIVNYYIDKNET